MTSEQDDALAQTQTYVRDTLSGESSGHDWWHVYRVWRLAQRIGSTEGVDLFVVELAALLHDIADWKFHDGDLAAGPRAARAWLESINVASDTIDHVCTIIGTLSFKGAGVSSPMSTREGMVVQDADRLDAIGAIGVARAFAYGGHAGRLMYDPDVHPEHHQSAAAYRSSNGPTINHFYEKLLLVRDLINTDTARAIAVERHAFMESFLKRFYQEWDGQDIQ